MQVSPSQLALKVSLQDGLSFDNFYSTPANEQLVNRLRDLSSVDGFQVVALWGTNSSGRSHLLQAAVQNAEQHGASALFLPSAELCQFSPNDILSGLESYELIALDDIDTLFADSQWQVALFDFFNRLHDVKHKFIFSCSAPIAELDIPLADLASRLSWGETYHVFPLSDEEKISALKLRAHTRGMAMADDVAKYIMSRSSRDVAHLMTVLDTLDGATIEAQRKLTIPFVREVCGWF